ncbi:MAG TPA: J domain-containing protein [Kofleriaceae bacterium]|nr:J domain-containing protein [Kofleriaceae bacterium]
MTSVLLALADVGLGVQLEEQLVAAGLPTTWDAQQVDGPRGAQRADVVIVDADHLGARLSHVASSWRASPALPGVLAIGSSSAARAQAPLARLTLVAPTARIPTLIAAIRDAAALRLATGMRWPLLRAALGLPAADDAPAAWQPTLAAARTLAIDIPRAALRWHVQHYVTPTPRLATLRDERALTVPELETLQHVDGTRTVQALVKLGPLDPIASARLLWTLGSMDALAFSAEIHDTQTPARRALAELRAHLRARAARLERSTFYDVLELTPLAEPDDIEAAYQLVARRFAPAVIAGHDLAEVAALVQPIWDLVEKARAVLLDHAQRGRYHDWLRQKLPELRTTWALDAATVTAATAAYARGQRALGDGDVHKAMSDLAAACRAFPGHPEYEASLAWARYRVQVASGRDRLEAAHAERRTVEDLLLGRRPWPRALVALALLCAAASDIDSARWHLHTALTIDPHDPAARQLAHRLGLRRA